MTDRERLRELAEEAGHRGPGRSGDVSRKHKPEPLTTGLAFCRLCGRPINVVREIPATEAEAQAAGRYFSHLTWRHNPPRGVPHPRRTAR